MVSFGKDVNSMNGVMLVNLGTPQAPEPSAVGAFLTEFLSDPRVIDLPRWIWIPVLRLAIVPLRRYRSAEAYRKIWTPEGSPLMTGSVSLAKGLQEELKDEAIVKLAMRYGKPEIRRGLEELREAGVKELKVLPLYPQYSATTTESIFDAVSKELRSMEWFPELESFSKYHDDEGWVCAVADSITEFQSAAGKPDKLVFSLHGIPQRYITNGDPYASQCEQSVRDITLKLGLADEEWVLTFQSRVGRETWLQPYTDQVLKELGASTCKHVQVVCPGFAVDCLETLEEIDMQNREFFLQSGGEVFEYIPALNNSDSHIAALASLVRG
ncbi:MAG: ferrochelatase [Rhodothermales bacterium]